MEKFRFKKQSMISLTLVLSLILGFFVGPFNSSKAFAEDGETQDSQKHIISQDNMSQKLSGGWEDWGNLKYVNDNGNHVIALDNDGGAGLYFENYKGPKNIVIDAKGKLGPKESVEPGILQIEYWDENGERIGNRLGLHRFTSHEYESVSVPVSIPDNAANVQISIYKNPGQDFAFFDDIFVYSLEGPVVGYPKEDGGPVDHIKLEDLIEQNEPIQAEETPSQPEKENIIELNVNLVKNPDFEQDFDNKNSGEKAEINNWPNDLDKDISEDNLGQTRITTDGYQGSNSIVTGPGEGGRSQFILGVPENMKFVLRVVGKVSHPNEIGYFGVDALDEDMKKIGGGKFGGKFTETDWKEKSFEFTTIPGTRALQVYTYKNPSPDGQDSYAYYDNFELIALGNKEDLEKEDNKVNPVDNPKFINPINKHQDGFFDDFDNGLDPTKWLISKDNWGTGNNGLSPKNVTVKDGKVIITANGDLYEGPDKGYKRIDGKITPSDSGKRTGGAIVTRDFFASGRYEVRARLLNELGVVNAFWTYFNNGVRNDEIDWESPGVVDGIPQVSQIMANTWVDDISAHSFIVDSPKVLATPDGVAEGWHDFRFDWYTEKGNARVEFYLDGKHVYTSTSKVPTAAGRFFLGLWFPQNWAGQPNFDTGTMEIDWVRITPFNNDGDAWLRGYNNHFADLSEYPHMPMDRTLYKNIDNFTYLDVEEMNDKRHLSPEAMEDYINQFKDYGINMQFVDMGLHNRSGELIQTPEKEKLVKFWIDQTRSLYPEMKIMGTINARARETIEISDTIIDKMVEEAVRIYHEYKFDGIQVDIEPFNVNNHPKLIQYLQKLHASLPDEAHISIATTALAKYLPNKNISEIAKYVDMINPMLYDVSGDDEGIVYLAEDFTNFWKENVLRYSEAIEESENPNVQLAPIMPAYDDKSYPGSPGWPDKDSGKIYYHLHEYENIKAAADGLKQALEEGAKVYGSGLFWWGTFTMAEYDQRDSQDYSLSRDWWVEEWLKADLDSKKGEENSDVTFPIIPSDQPISKLKPIFKESNSEELIGPKVVKGQEVDIKVTIETDAEPNVVARLTGPNKNSEDVSDKLTFEKGSIILTIPKDLFSQLALGSYKLDLSVPEGDQYKEGNLTYKFEVIEGSLVSEDTEKQENKTSVMNREDHQQSQNDKNASIPSKNQQKGGKIDNISKSNNKESKSNPKTSDISLSASGLAILLSGLAIITFNKKRRKG